MSTLSVTSVLDGGGWSTSCPGRFNLGKVSRYPLHRRLGVPRNRYALARKISLPLGIDPRTAYPVDCSYTDNVLLQ